MKHIAYFLILILLISACTRESKIIDNTDDSWRTLQIVKIGDRFNLSLYNMPDNVMAENDVYSKANNNPMPSEPTKLAEYGNMIFILYAKIKLIEVIDLKTYKLKASIDYSSKSLEPSGICFANSTTAYVCHPNDSVISQIDITNFKVTKTIKTGPNPVSISVSGNQLLVANQGNNTLSIIDTRTDKVEANIPVPALPSIVDITNEGDKAIIVSIGEGKINNSNPKSNAQLSVIDIAKRSLLSTKDLGSGAFKAIDQIPIGLVIGSKNYGFVITKDNLFRFVTKTGDGISRTESGKYISIGYNFKRDEIYYLRTGSSGNSELILTDPNTGTKKLTKVLQGEVLSLFPLAAN